MRRRRVPRIDTTTPLGVGGLYNAIAQDTLDLHGQTVAEAQVSIHRFLERAARRFPGDVVRIITGRGNRSAGKPKLGAALESELERAAHLVRESRRSDDGGSWLIRLR